MKQNHYHHKKNAVEERKMMMRGLEAQEEFPFSILVSFATIISSSLRLTKNAHDTPEHKLMDLLHQNQDQKSSPSLLYHIMMI